MNHQDFKPVVLRKNIVNNKAVNKAVPKNKDESHKEDGIIVVPKTFTKEFGNKLTAARVSKNMNRTELSLKLNMKENVIADIENGKLLYDGNIVHKLKKLFPNLL